MSKSEAIAVNVLLHACGVHTPRQDVTPGPDAIIGAIGVLAQSANKALTAGVRRTDVDAWRARDAVLPSFELFDALTNLRALDASVWFDQATAFSCREADVIAAVLHGVERSDAAAEFMAYHAEGDDEGRRPSPRRDRRRPRDEHPMTAGRTTVTLTLDDLGLLRVWLDEGRTQRTENEADTSDIDALDAKLHRAVQRCYVRRTRR